MEVKVNGGDGERKHCGAFISYSASSNRKAESHQLSKSSRHNDGVVLSKWCRGELIQISLQQVITCYLFVLYLHKQYPFHLIL